MPAAGVAEPGPGRACVEPWAATTYDGIVRAMVVGHKEHRRSPWPLPLGDLLAAAVYAALTDRGRARPGRAGAGAVAAGRSARQRGHEPTAAITRAAAAVCARRSRRTACPRCSAPAGGSPTRPASTLPARAANLAGALRAHPPAAGRLAEGAADRSTSWCPTT